MNDNFDELINEYPFEYNNYNFDDLISEYATEYSVYRNNKKSQYTINRIKHIYRKIDNILRSKCASEFAKVEEFCQRNEVNQFIPKEGKEKEANKALLQLKNCPHNLAHFQNKINSINKLSEIILERQTEICLEECLYSSEDDDICIKACFFKNHNNTLRAFDEHLNSQLSVIEKQINKF